MGRCTIPIQGRTFWIAYRSFVADATRSLLANCSGQEKARLLRYLVISTSAAKALQIIGDLTATAEVGKTYLGKVTRLADFGALVEIIPGTDGLLHISEVADIALPMSATS